LTLLAGVGWCNHDDNHPLWLLKWCPYNTTLALKWVVYYLHQLITELTPSSLPR
jgi:hypothetical protein